MNNAEIFSLRIRVGQGEPFIVPISQPIFTIGSASEVNLTLAERFVSRRHFRVEVTSQRVYVTDLGSQNGILLNGYRVPPQQPLEWRPGTSLTIADHIFIELLSPVMPQREQQPSNFSLSVTPTRLRANQTAQLTLSYSGGSVDEHVYFKAHTPDSLHATFTPAEGFVAPNMTVGVQAQVKKTRALLMGGRFPVSFMAITPDGTFAKADATVYVRPRFELLLLLLLLLLIPAGLAVPQVTRIAIISTATTTPTITDTPEPSATPTKADDDLNPLEVSSATVTATTTLTTTPTLTVTVSVTPAPICVNRCAAMGWSNYVVQPGDTLSSLSAAADVSMSLVQEVNCIADAGDIDAFSTICLPIVPIVPPSALNLSIAQACDRSTNTVTFTVTNNGVPMTTPDSARIWDGFRRDLITPGAFQLNTGQSLSFAFSYRTTPGYYGNILFFTGSGAQSVSTDCMPTPTGIPPVNPTTPAPPPTPLPVLLVGQTCQVVDVCSDGCLRYIVNFTVSNTGGAMSVADNATLRDPTNAVVGGGVFQLSTGQNQVFSYQYPDTDSPSPITFTTAATGLSAVGGCLPPTAQITSPVTFCIHPDANCEGTGVGQTGSRTMNFTGTGTDPEDGTLSGGSLVWSISAPDFNDPMTTLGTGGAVDATLNLADPDCDFASNLFETAYEIRLTVTDSDGLSATDSALIWLWQFCTILN